MKLTIDLSEYQIDDESLAKLIQDEIQAEVRLAFRRLIKEALKDSQTVLKKVVEDAVKRDWRKMAAILETLKDGQDKV